MSEKEPVKSGVLYTKVKETMNVKEELTLSTESQTDEGAWSLFMKLKKEMKIDE